ncbi:MBL fold metallo-hydrolase [Actinokineospora bangkokensis]|uniref:MBL fold metallo-hydrolase n=1 Tax=Actinokineospora bangkokensis TaxID=1193682 RepID=A0A1Q9LJ06_9PSEU|nr:MBL fold metallo-hydrolase [Actinokineospora bangkokensis]
MRPWLHLLEPSAAASLGQVRATFLGVSTVLLDDGHTAVLTDGFFSRPGIVRTLARRIAPDRARIAAALRLAGVTDLAAVFVCHSHYDHALDSAVVAAATGAQLLGSTSTARTAGILADHRVTVVQPGQPMRFGEFTLTALPAQHSPGDRVPGTIDHPLDPPARMRDWRTGDCYSLHVTHRDRALLVHASANFLPGALADQQADTVYLGVGTLGKQDDRFRADYWAETVTAVGARRVLPIHWDNFTRPLHRPLRPLPRVFDDFNTTMRFLTQAGSRDGVSVQMPLVGSPADPWPDHTRRTP